MYHSAIIPSTLKDIASTCRHCVSDQRQVFLFSQITTWHLSSWSPDIPSRPDGVQAIDDTSLGYHDRRDGCLPRVQHLSHFPLLSISPTPMPLCFSCFTNKRIAY